MSGGYYDPHPLVSLSVPLVLVGHPGSGVAPIGRGVAARTGLPFNDVARSAEASAGCSRSQLVVEHGIGALRRAETRALARAIRRRPCGVVVLSSGALEEADARRWLAADTRTVYVRRPLPVLLDGVRRTLARAPGSLPEFLMGAPEDPDSLGSYLAPREALLASFDAVVEAGDRTAVAVAGEILASLGRLVPVAQPSAER